MTNLEALQYVLSFTDRKKMLGELLNFNTSYIQVRDALIFIKKLQDWAERQNMIYNEIVNGVFDWEEILDDANITKEEWLIEELLTFVRMIQQQSTKEVEE